MAVTIAASPADQASTVSKLKRRLGPHSRSLARGAVGQAISGRSREGRFLRAFERQLTDHVGGQPSATMRMLISRLTRVALRLELYDERILIDGVLTDHDARVYGALHNTFRLLLREVGVKPAAAKTRFSDYLPDSSRVLPR